MQLGARTSGGAGTSGGLGIGGHRCTHSQGISYVHVNIWRYTSTLNPPYGPTLSPLYGPTLSPPNGPQLRDPPNDGKRHAEGHYERRIHFTLHGTRTNSSVK